MVPAGPVRSRGRWGIGQVLAELRVDFPTASISKIRFLEAEGLVSPERTASGYRKFSRTDVERLRYVMSAQRDHYLPLKVIREHLDAMDRGLEPAANAGEPARAPRRSGGDAAAAKATPDDSAPALRMSRAELLSNSGLSDEQLTELVGYGLVEKVPETDFFDGDALDIATTLAAMAGYGLEPRHMRAFKTAAERQVGLIDQVTTPYRAQRGSEPQGRADDASAHLGQLAVQLHAALVRRGLRRTA
ncbi:MAG: MerR family transcriptional regulator [Nocardioidaceae bacterium]|nr:MerR family transcriptional regulator [Nocardioidaceae bacterium]